MSSNDNSTTTAYDGDASPDKDSHLSPEGLTSTVLPSDDSDDEWKSYRERSTRKLETPDVDQKEESKEEINEELKGKLTGPLALATFAVTLSSFQFGFHIGCINAPQKLITAFFETSHEKLFGSVLENPDLPWSVAVSIFAFGGMIGGLASGKLADRFGRKGSLLLNNALAFIAAALMGFARMIDVYPMMIAGRLVIGVHCGLASGLVPMYLTEVSPVNLRGMLGSIHQLLVTVAILVSQILGLPYLLGNEERWPLIFGFTIVPSVLQLITLPMCCETPKYTLVKKQNIELAEKDLRRLRGKEDVSAEVEQMNEEVREAQESTVKVSMGAMFKYPLLRPMIIAIMMMLSQQLSGINVAMFFSTTIFRGAGLEGDAPFYATIGMGTVNVIMTIIAVWLVDHPKFGRRSLHLIGQSGMLITSVLLVVALSILKSGEDTTPNPNQWVSYAAIALVLLFVISFATGPGAIPWFFVSEIFGSEARGNANSIAVMVNWTANLVVGLSFLPLEKLMQQYVFLIFSGFLSFFIFYTWKFVPETKGKSIDEITRTINKC